MRSGNRGEAWVGVGVLALGGLLAMGAGQIGGDAGYGGISPSFLPWVVSAALVLLGIGLIVSALRSTSVLVEKPEFPPRWKAVAWVSLGLLLNALLIEHLGFVCSCALLFGLAARGFRIGADGTPTLTVLAKDLGIGVLLSAPVFWLFTRVLGLTLPALLSGGWI